MTRDILNKSSPGTSTAFGADDLDYINKLLTGVDQTSTDPVDINTLWTFRNLKLRIANPVNSLYYTIAPSAITADRTLTLPLLTADDTAVALDFPQPLTNKTISAVTNTLDAVVRTPEARVTGFVVGSATATGMGMFAGNVSQTGGTINTTTTDGKFVRYTSGTTVGNDAGVRVNTNVAAVLRGKNCHFKARFRFAPSGGAQLTNSRMFCGFTSTTAGFMTSDDPLNALSGFGVSVITSNSNFRIASNDGTGATAFTNIGAGVAVDSNIHTIEILADNAGTGFKYSWDGGAYSSLITSDVPAQDDLLVCMNWTETAETAAKVLDSWYMIADQDP